MMRGDLAKINFGKHVVIQDSVILRPAYTYAVPKDSTNNKKIIKFSPI